MRSTFYFLIVLLVLTWYGCGNTATPDSPPAMNLANEAEILDSSFLAAYNRGDIDGVMALYWNSPSLRAYGPAGEPINGHAAFRELLVRDFAMFKNAKLIYTSTENLVFNDVVIGHGTFDWSVPVSGDSTMITHGRYTEVKAVKDGKLVIILDHVSIPMPTE